ncbi:methylated-DNA--protein-cysteine methyltransferase [Geothrix limicola]|uniref:Methylated-DNA--protein-cysteine methyltransferase n=1 Tax=Geothrix limicola TaxID=2927978 RepID=A0ABQ5QEZ7_9BACT|nr:methylated-DNA--[protein]-cysteine S-methyltransferase [Geothrix limicola]GLH72614.1 methylated-DNA--protein-cysteine methyltransferase [Geothrix limicola]
MSGFHEISTSLGRFQVAFDAEGALIYLGFAGREYRESLRVKVARQATALDPDAGVLARLKEQLEAYAAGTRRTFDIPLRLHGTPFEQRVWAALQRIPFGETRSYGQLAAELGGSALSRAVGRANGANPISILVPCHRLVGANGSLTGYAGGLALKERLLRLEGAIKD